MAIVVFGAAVSDIRGSIGGWTFHRNRAGNIIRTKGTVGRFPTPKQTLSQSAHVRLLALFQALTFQQKIDWDTFATIHTKRNLFDEVKTLTGQNWFESINFNRELVGQLIIDSPPVFRLARSLINYLLIVNANKIELQSISPNNPMDNSLIIRTTQPITRTTNSLRGLFRLTKVIPAGPFGTIDITNDWKTTHSLNWPPVAGQNNFVICSMLSLVNQDSGQQSIGVIMCDDLSTMPVGIGFMIIDSTFIVG